MNSTAENKTKNEIAIMGSVKQIPKLEGFNGCTIAMAAEYFKTSYCNVYAYVSNYKGQMESMGMEEVCASDLLSNGYRFINRSTYERNGKTIHLASSRSSIKVLPKECMLFIAKRLTGCSEVAREIVGKINASYYTAENAISVVDGCNGMQQFTNEQFGNVRVIMRDGEPWFVAADVCRALEISNNRDALSRLDEDEKDVASTDTLGGKQILSIINEPGLYSLVLGSRKPEARAFKRWITHDVIPSIRKTGVYVANPSTLEDYNNNVLLEKLRFLEESMKKLIEMNENTNERMKMLEANTMTVHEANNLIRFNKDRDSIVKSIIKMMQFYAGKKRWGRLGYAWKELYSKAEDRYGIDVYQRKQANNGNGSLISYVSDAEIDNVFKLAYEMVEELGACLESFLVPGMICIAGDVEKESA